MAKKILAVDDSASMRQAIGMALRPAGYDVIEASDGLDGKLKLAEPVDMVITDLNMPRMDGIEFIKHIRTESKQRHVPIMMLTTESHPERKLAAKQAGATCWLVKPFDPQQLLAVIRRVLP